jgi:hypothetical protein
MAIGLLTVGACVKEKKVVGDAAGAPFVDGLTAYLQQRGTLCLDYPRWPVDVTAHDRAIGSREARQLPVLETLGLASSEPLAASASDGQPGQPPPVTSGKRYLLTGAGRALYIVRETRTDLCPVTLTLNKVISARVQPPTEGAPEHATVAYTYDVTAPAWARDARFAQAFPAIGRLINGAGYAQLVEGFTRTGAGWTANELVPAAPPSTTEAGLASMTVTTR